MSLLLRKQITSCIRFSVKTQQRNNRFMRTSQLRYSIIARRGLSEERERDLAAKDNVPKNYELIYRAAMENYVSSAKNVSTLTASAIAGLAAYKFALNMHLIPISSDISLAGLVTNESDIWFFAAGFIAINLAVRVFVAKFPMRIYRNEDKYIAIYDSQLPFRVIQHQFKQGDVAEVRHSLNPWKDSMYRLGNRTSLLLVDYFKTPSEFHNLFGMK